MYQFEGKEYKDMTQISAIIDSRKQLLMNKEILECLQKENERSIVQAEYHRLKIEVDNLRISLENEWRKIKDRLLSTVENAKYNFIASGFYIAGELGAMSDNSVEIITPNEALLMYSYVRNGDNFFIKAMPVAKIPNMNRDMIEYYPIAIADYRWTSTVVAICRGSNGPICFTANKRNSRWGQVRISDQDKKLYISRATIPLEEDRIYLTRWVMKLNNKGE